MKTRALEKELHRLEKALAEVVALLRLSKKAQTIWGTDPIRLRNSQSTGRWGGVEFQKNQGSNVGGPSSNKKHAPPQLVTFTMSLIRFHPSKFRS